MNAPVLLRPRDASTVPVEQLRFLGFAHELEEGRPPRLAGTVIYTVAGLVVAGLVWASVTPIHQTAVAPGQVIPAGSISTVQHLEGGIVARVVAMDGALVAAGDPLLELDGAAAISELKTLRSRELMLAAQQKRLSAFVNGGELRGSLDESGATSDPLEVQSSILDAQRQSKQEQREVLERQLSAKRAEQAALGKQISLAEKQAALAVQEREARRELFSKGLTTRAAYLESQRADNRAQSDLAALQGQLERISEAIFESEARLRELDARLASDAEVEYGQVSSELMQVRESLTKLQDRVDRLVVRAPVAGRLKDLKVRSPGAVIPPGMVVAEIVPQDQRLKVEARLSPRDVGHVRPGQEVAVKVDSFAFSTYGAIIGHLERIAASTTTDPDGALYYKAVIALDRDYAGADPSRNLLQSGMTVQADIVTGERSILQHLVEPVHAALAGALHER
jgi:HlyD family type I secretion membrane fusion protein